MSRGNSRPNPSKHRVTASVSGSSTAGSSQSHSHGPASIYGSDSYESGNSIVSRRSDPVTQNVPETIAKPNAINGDSLQETAETVRIIISGKELFSALTYITHVDVSGDVSRFLLIRGYSKIIFLTHHVHVQQI